MKRLLLLVAFALLLVSVPAVATLPVPSGDKFIIAVGSTTTGNWWKADYFRNLPYTSNTGWTDGDRCAYRTAYAFLTLGGEVVGRVTFARVPGANYAIVNDKYMKEGQRFYDGTVYTGLPTQELGDCPTVTQAYEPFTGPGELPTIRFDTVAGELLEVRDYKTLTAGVGVTFQQTESSTGRITVVAYKDGLPVVVVYYDSLSPNVVLASDLDESCSAV